VFEERPTITLQKTITADGSNKVLDVSEDRVAIDEDDGELNLGK
jgi:hypothetical protein